MKHRGLPNLCWLRPLFAWMITALSTASISQAEDDWAPSEYLAHVKLDTSLGMLAVPITIGSKKGLAILDTGASYTIIDTKLRREADEPLDEVLLSTSNAPIRLQRYRSPEIVLAEMKCSLETVCLYDLDFLKAGRGMDVDAIVGMDFLSRFVLFVDYREGNLYVCEKLHVKKAIGNQLPLKLMNINIPSLDIEVSGRSVTAALDTGNLESLSLDSDEFDRLAHEQKLDLDCKPVAVFALDRSLNWQLSSRGRVGIGELNCDRVFVTRSNQCQIGLRFLSRTKWVADFPNNRFFVRPGAFYSSIDHGDCDGISLTSFSNDLIISNLHTGCVAELNGCKVGDVILEVGGKRVKANDQPTVVSLLMTYREEPLRLLVRRGSREIPLELPK